MAKPPRLVPESYVLAIQERAARAEDCLRRVLNLVNPELLTKHANDWAAATEELCADE